MSSFIPAVYKTCLGCNNSDSSCKTYDYNMKRLFNEVFNLSTFAPNKLNEVDKVFSWINNLI